MELNKVVKDKKFWFASFLITWAAALQVSGIIPILLPISLIPQFLNLVN